MMTSTQRGIKYEADVGGLKREGDEGRGSKEGRGADCRKVNGVRKRGKFRGIVRVRGGAGLKM